MKTFISDIIPSIQRYSHKLDNLTLLSNQQWVIVDDTINSKHVYIFRNNGELLVSQNGRVEKAKWEYLGHDTLLIDRKDESLLFRHGFFDENVLALKTDGIAEYVFLVNESKFSGGMNTTVKVVDFLNSKYFISQPTPQQEPHPTGQSAMPSYIDIRKEYNLPDSIVINTYKTSRGLIEMYKVGSHYKVFYNGLPAPSGKYKLGFLWYVYVEDGILVRDSVTGMA